MKDDPRESVGKVETKEKSMICTHLLSFKTTMVFDRNQLLMTILKWIMKLSALG